MVGQGRAVNDSLTTLTFDRLALSAPPYAESLPDLLHGVSHGISVDRKLEESYPALADGRVDLGANLIFEDMHDWKSQPDFCQWPDERRLGACATASSYVRSLLRRAVKRARSLSGLEP